MILNQLKLCNFCIYQGEQTFDLTPDRRRGSYAPIVLFGGINGGGKTTLLDAVQLVLYGKRARCSKRGGKAYNQFLLDCINRDVDPYEGASVQLTFQYAAEGQPQVYRVTRSWSIARENVREQVEVSRDGEIDGWLSDNWSQMVDDLIPFGIAQLCFFDAEKIRFLAEDETSTEALGEAIKSLLGLDLAERLVADTSVLEDRLAKRTKKSSDLNELEQLSEALAAKQLECRKLKQDRGGIVPLLERAENLLQAAEERFSKIGGRHWEQREERQRQHGELQQSVRNTEEELVKLAASELPMAMVASLLRDMEVQADREQAANDAAVITQLLDVRDETLLAALKAQNVDNDAVDAVRDLLAFDRDARAKGADVETWLELPELGRRRLVHLMQIGLTERMSNSASLLQQLESSRRELETLQRNLAATPKEDAIREVATELKAATSQVSRCEQQIDRIDRQLATAQFERGELQKRVQKLRRKVIDEEIGSEENVRIAELLQRTRDAMQDFLKRAAAAKIDRLSQLVTTSFRHLLRKKSLVERVSIDSETFRITLIDVFGNSVPKDELSEGEKQVFAISVLWGLSQASARPLPAIIDTPMGRLDSEHRIQLVERYFPHASHQVIILSTDTEIEREFFHELEPHIARAYHLSYDEDRRATRVEEGYFWESAPVPSIEEAMA